MIKSYQDLEVWQKAMDLAEAIYVATRNFPKEEIYGLTSQMRRAAVSIPSNIAEGYGRESTPDWIRMLRISQGSLKELETQTILATRLMYLSKEKSEQLLQESASISRMLRALINSLKSRA